MRFRGPLGEGAQFACVQELQHAVNSMPPALCHGCSTVRQHIVIGPVAADEGAGMNALGLGINSVF